MAAVAVCSRDSVKSVYIREPNIPNLSHALPSGIQDAALCSLGRNNLSLFYESKRLNNRQIYRNQTQFLFLSLQQLALDVRCKDKRPKFPVRLLLVAGGSIATAIKFAVSRALCGSKTAQRRTGLCDYQTSQSLIESLLLRLAATIPILILEVSSQCVKRRKVRGRFDAIGPDIYFIPPASFNRIYKR